MDKNNTHIIFDAVACEGRFSTGVGCRGGMLGCQDFVRFLIFFSGVVGDTEALVIIERVVPNDGVVLGDIFVTFADWSLGFIGGCRRSVC